MSLRSGYVLRRALPTAVAAVVVGGGLIAAGVGQADQPAARDAARAPAAKVVALPAGTPTFAKKPFGQAEVAKQARQARRGQLAAAVRRPVLLRARPGGPVLGRIGTRTGYGAPRVLAVGAVRYGWLGVRTLQRTDGKLGWFPAVSAKLRRMRTLLVADLSDRKLTLRVDGEVSRTAAVGIGRQESPTPLGRYGVADRLAAEGSAYGCCIITLTGHQPKLPAGWTGGTRIALHGTETPGSIGSEVSAGCLRMRDEELKALLPHIPLGTTLVVRD